MPRKSSKIFQKLRNSSLSAMSCASSAFSPFDIMVLVDTARKYIGGGIQFDRADLTALKPKIESAIRLVKKGQR